jgi:hypothetical protein
MTLCCCIADAMRAQVTGRTSWRLSGGRNKSLCETYLPLLRKVEMHEGRQAHAQTVLKPLWL